MAAADSIRISVIDQIGVQTPDSAFRRLQPAQRQLLSLLVAAGPKGLTADRLADEIWPDRLPNQWQSAVRMTVSRLRRSCGANFVEMVDSHYRLTVDIEQVDAWYLEELTGRSKVALAGGDVEQVAALLSPGEVYAGVERTLTIESSAREIEHAQRELISAASRRSLVLPRNALRNLYRRVLAAPYEETLCLDVAHLHAVAGLVEPAKDLIAQTREEIRQSFGVEVSDELLDLERRLAHGAFGNAKSEDNSDAVADRVPPASALPLALQTDGEVSVRTDATRKLGKELARTQAVILLTAPAGSASLRLISHALEVLDRDAGSVLFGRCSEGVTQSYEPFVEMLPGFRGLVAQDAGRTTPTEPTIMWSAVAEELARLAGPDPVTAIVHQAHDVDSASVDLIAFLARSALGFPLRLLLSGRNDIDRPEFARLQRLLGSYEGVSKVVVDPLTVDQVSQLVAQRFPHASSAALRSLSEEVRMRSGGLYDVAQAIIDRLDPATLRLPEGGVGLSMDVFSHLVAGLSPTARSVGVAAAVLGRDASLSDLQQMSDLGPDELLDVVDELLDTGLLVETAGVDRLSFAHQLAMDEFIQQTRKIRLRQMHMKARNLTDDPHRRARHDLLAHPTVPTAEVRASQLRSARLLYSHGSFRESAAAFRNAQSVQPDVPLGTADSIAHAESVSRTGALAEAAELRSEVIRRCIAEGDWDSVLDAALVGLPEAELIDGDPERFAQLSSIPSDQLAVDRRFEHALHLTRQASLLGREEVSRVWVERAQASAEKASEKASAALAWRMANDVKAGPAERLDRIEDALKVASSRSDRMHLLQVAALDRYELGDVEVALTQNDEFVDLAAELSNALRMWHGKLFRSMHMFTIGAWDDASSEADAALEHGQRFGITVASPTRLAQEFFLLWLADSHGSLVPLLDTVPPADASTLLFQAAHSACLFADGQVQRAVTNGAQVARRFLAAPAAHGLASVALLAPVLAASNDAELIERVESALAPHVGSALLVGAGVGNLGPVERFIGQLRGRPDVGQIRTYVTHADRLHMPVWRLLTRLEAYERTADSNMLSEAVQIAAGTALERFLPAGTKES
ncbi:MAG: hypothetical protein ACN4GZ_03295 [Acidimicrobiales bacterium]